MSIRSWTEADFDQLSWHDNHVHGLTIRGGEHGWGELVLDLDHILEWRCQTDKSIRFVVAPATLTFHEMSNLVVALNYAKPEAGMTPFSVDSINRELVTYPNGYSSYRWNIPVNWPTGSLSFTASGFKQVLRGAPREVSDPCLPPTERTGDAGGV